MSVQVLLVNICFLQILLIVQNTNCKHSSSTGDLNALMTICLLIPPRALSPWSFKLMTQATEFVQQMKFVPGLLNIFVIC